MAAPSSSSSSLSHRQRLTSNWHLNPEERITPPFNDQGQPIGDEAVRLSTAHGLVARMGNFCPITIDNWRNMPKTNKEEMYKYMKEHFNISTAEKKYVLKSINAAWKNHKVELRRGIDNLVKMGYSWETISNNTPEGVEHKEWRQFVSTYLVEKRAEWETKTANGRKIRAMNQENHTLGRKSLARKRKELGPIGEVEFYKICHTKKKDRSMNEYSSRIVEQCEALIRERTLREENVDRLALEEEVVREVRGPEHPGRVRGQGRGPTHSSMRILSIRNAGLEMQKAEIERQRAEIEELKKRDVARDAEYKAMQAREAARDAELKEMKEQLRLLCVRKNP